MPVAAPQEGYAKMIAYGQKKISLRADQLALQSFMAGFWVAIYGHACTVFASSFYYKEHWISPGLSSLAFGAMFPGAFVAVVYTGTELFTGNTVTMVMVVFHEGLKALKHLARVWIFSLVGNFAGAIFGAFFFSYLSGAFRSSTRGQEFLFYLASKKVNHGFGENIVLGVGCNALICLATWCVVCSDDGAGKILAMFYTVAVFATGGFEHVVANFYLLSAATFCGFYEPFWRTVVHNWIPVLIGNLLAGTLFTGVMWWYALHPTYSELSPFSNLELERELNRRAGTISARSVSEQLNEPGLLKRDSSLRWQTSRQASGMKEGSFFLTPHHLVPIGGGARRERSSIASDVLPVPGSTPLSIQAGVSNVVSGTSPISSSVTKADGLRSDTRVSSPNIPSIQR